MLMISVETLARLSSGNSIVWAKEDSSSLPTPQDLLNDLASDLDSLKSPFTPKLPLPAAPGIETKPAAPGIETKPAAPEIKTKTEPARPDIKQPSLASPQPPPVKAVVNLPTVTISGLVWDTDHPQAIVNDQIVSVGDKIENWSITAINEQGIELSFDGIKRFIASNKFSHNDGKAF